MKIAAWNVNSVKSRLQHLTKWLHENQPDILMLQELKCEEQAFPQLEVSGLGYSCYIAGQKTYNGVAILSKNPLNVTAKRLPGDDADEQARYIEAETQDKKWRFASVYVPNGQDPQSDKYGYKLNFLKRLDAHMKTVLRSEQKFVIGGDFNVAFQDIDVFDPKIIKDQILFTVPERQAMYQFLHLGFTDCFRALHPDAHEFSWWDYRGMGFERNLGLRIDYLFASPQAADLVKSASIDKNPRGWDKASDHAPVVAEFSQSL